MPEVKKSLIYLFFLLRNLHLILPSQLFASYNDSRSQVFKQCSAIIFYYVGRLLIHVSATLDRRHLVAGLVEYLLAREECIKKKKKLKEIMICDLVDSCLFIYLFIFGDYYIGNYGVLLLSLQRLSRLFPCICPTSILFLV